MFTTLKMVITMAKTRTNIRKLTDEDVRLARQLNEDAEERIYQIENELLVLQKSIIEAKRRIRDLNAEKLNLSINVSAKTIAEKFDISVTSMDKILKYETYAEVR